ncbi:MAG: peptidylprolyl isomerase [Acidimicrobiales bacterium]
MGTEKRERQKANRQKKMEELHRTEKKDDLRGRVILFATIALLLLGGLFAWSQLSGDDDNANDTAAGEAVADSGDDATTETTTDAADSVDPMDPIPADCPPADGAPQALQFQSAPEMCIDVAKTYTAEVSTSMGDFTIALDPERAPLTVNNFVFLARYHYYDGATFHRVIPGFVIQGGDPVGDPPGIGGPGYSFADELPAEGEYELGSLAMANSGADTNGSQFFVITGDQGIALPPQYSLFGKVTDGLDVALAIQDVETDAGDAPVEPVVINSVTITES